MAVDIIAEVGSVHDGSFGNALRLIELAKDVGASTVKFQMHISEHETTRDAPSPSYFSAESRYDYFERTGFTMEEWAKLVAAAGDAGLDFCCSPFSVEALDRLVSLGVRKIKIPSGEVTNLPLLKAARETDGQIIISSGMSDWAELDRAMDTLGGGTAEVAILQCSSQYPCTADNVGLNVIGEMRERYSCTVGLSDHTMGLAASVGAAFAGAEIIEKHLTFSRAMYGSDAKHSLEPEEFARMVAMIREAEAIRDNPVDKDRVERYADMKQVFEKSAAAAHDLDAGAEVGEGDVVFLKPGTGIPAHRLNDFLGRRLRSAIAKGQLFSTDDFE